MPFELFDRSRLRLLPLSERIHDLDLSIMMPPVADNGYRHATIDLLAERIRVAKAHNANVTMMLGGHVIRAGVAPCMNAMMEAGYINHFALNGASAIHDFELALIGPNPPKASPSTSPRGNSACGRRTACTIGAVNEGAKQGLGLRRGAGQVHREEARLSHKRYSLLAAGYRHQVPVTVHVGIGCDIVHEQPNADGALLGEASYRDFLIYARRIERLEHGVFMDFGSAVIGPEVYLKALSMARNVAHQERRRIAHFTTEVFDLLDLEGKELQEDRPSPIRATSNPPLEDQSWRRTVASGGEATTCKGVHREPSRAGLRAAGGQDG